MKKLNLDFYQNQIGFLKVLLVTAVILFAAAAAQAATFTVNLTTDSGDGTCDATCTLRDAITSANAQAGDDVIEFDQTVFATAQTITLGGTELSVANNGRLTINGTDATRLSISANQQSRVFNVGSGANLSLNALTVTGGSLTNVFDNFGGGILNYYGTVTITNSIITGNSVSDNSSSNRGGGICNYGGTLTITNSTVSGNSASDSSGFSNTYGGGISNEGGSLTISGSIITGNSISGSNYFNRGGGIFNGGPLTITNSTISGNSASNGRIMHGGGIYNISSTLTITNSTVSGNSANNGLGTVGGGIYNNNGSVRTRNSIFAGNSVFGGSENQAPDFWGAAVSLGNNLIGNTAGSSGFGSSGDILNQNALLSPLGFYGGSTQTHALLPNSPAINAGNDCVTNLSCSTDNPPNALIADQRGASRVGQVDIGAFELQPDADGDGVEDVRDNCPNTPNPGQEDSNNNGIGDACEDQTPPVITPTVSGTLGNNDWYISDVQVSWNVVDDESPASTQNCDTVNVTNDTDGTTFTCSAQSLGGASSQSVTIKRDATAPSITFDSRTASNSADWNNTNVAVQWNCADALSGALSPSVSEIISTEGSNLSLIGICTDNAGNTATDTQIGINIDKTAPVLNPSVSPNPVLQGQSATASAGGTDDLSGVASQNCESVNTATPGNNTVNCTATDQAGNTANADAGYTVTPDGDGDGVADENDNCPTTANANQANFDGDAQGDVCDADDDNDGVSDADEIAAGSDPFNAASTPEICDGVDNDLNEGIDEGFTNTDGDALANCVDPDDDNDGQTDVYETACGSNPLDAASKSADNDNDNLPDCVDADDDNDTVADANDNCPFAANPDQIDSDGDGQGNVCDATPNGDGVQIVFSSNRDGFLNSEIYGMRADGSGVVRLTNNPALDFAPALSHDKTRILFTSTRNNNRTEIFVMNSDGSNVQRLTDNCRIEGIANWSPDGTKIVFTSLRDGNAEIYVMNADGTNLRRLTTNAKSDINPIWSPDGTKIAFASNRTGNNFEIYAMNAANGANVVRLTNNSAEDLLPTFSPDGAKIAFTSTRNGNVEIYSMNAANGANVLRLTTNTAIDGEPSWGEDNRILFTSTRDGNTKIFVMNANGTAVNQLTDNQNGFDLSPDW